MFLLVLSSYVLVSYIGVIVLPVCAAYQYACLIILCNLVTLGWSFQSYC